MGVRKENIIHQTNYHIWDRVPALFPSIGGATAPWGMVYAFNQWAKKLGIRWEASRISFASRHDLVEQLLQGRVVSSLKFWKKGGGFEDLWWRNDLSNGSIKEWIDSDNLPVALGAFQWEQVVNVAWHEAQNIGKKRYIEIHYEDFVADPLKTLKNTFDSVGLPDSKNVNRYIQSVRKVRDMNFKFTQNLTSNDIQIIKNITLNTARKAGYIF
jgi:hypothetical protein